MGEFKKRIEPLLDPQEHNGYNAGFCVDEDNVGIFWTIFEEAKKEFPDLSELFKIRQSHMTDDEAEKDAIKAFSNYAIAWFEKWFGEA